MPKGQYKRKSHTKERKENIKKAMEGKKHTLEARRNMSKARKGISLKHEGQFKKGHSAWNKKDKKYSRKTKRVGNKVIGESHFVYMVYNKLDEIPKGFVIHHIDENTFNNDITNLRLMRMEDHHFLHNVLDKERYKFKNKVKKLKEKSTFEIGKVGTNEKIIYLKDFDKIMGTFGTTKNSIKDNHKGENENVEM